MAVDRAPLPRQCSSQTPHLQPRRGATLRPTGFGDQLLVTIKINRADAEILATFVGLVPWDDLTALHE